MDKQQLKLQFEATPEDDWITQVKIIQEALNFQSYSDPSRANLETLAQIKCEMKRTGYYWQSDRVRAWMQSAGYQNKHFLDEKGFKILLKHLQNMDTVEEF